MPAYALDAEGAAPQTGNSTTRVLNGSDVRRGTTSYPYTANLYLEHKTASPAEALQNNGAKQFRMVMLHDASAAQMADLLTEGLVANASEDDLVTMVSEIFDVGVLLSEQGHLSAGDSFEIDPNPAAGSTLTIRSSTHTARPSRKPLPTPACSKS